MSKIVKLGILCSGLITAVVGCAGVEEISRSIPADSLPLSSPVESITPSQPTSSLQESSQPSTQFETALSLYEDERKFYRHDMAGLRFDKRSTAGSIGPRPQLCVALSGGGIRSATFAIGVMRSLHERGILNDVDVISSVSGGSYALGWLNSQVMKHQRTLDEIFKNDLRANGKMNRPVVIYDGWYLTPPAILSVGLAPVNFLINGFFGAHINLSLMPLYYERRLHNVYLAKKVDQKTTDEVRVYNLVDRGISDQKRPRLPFPIFSMTGSSRFIETEKTHRLGDVFEVTPISAGSDRYRYLDANKMSPDSEVFRQFTLESVMAASGAAVDSFVITSKKLPARILSGFNVDLGRYVDNFDKVEARSPSYLSPSDEAAGLEEARAANEEISDALAWRWVPLPGHYIYNKLKSREAPYNRHARIYLSDGGHSDNLGLVVLMKRMCREILVVDAEYSLNGTKDVFTYRYEAVCRVKRMFAQQVDASEGGWHLEFGKLDDRLRCNEPKPPSKDEKHEEREVKTDDSIHDVLICNDGNGNDVDCVGKNPIMSFDYQLSKIAVSGERGNKVRNKADTIPSVGKITLIKLSIDHSLALKGCEDSYPKAVCAFYDKQWSEDEKDSLKRGVAVETDGNFPQNRTLDQHFQADQYNAYVELGKHIADQYLKTCGQVQRKSAEKSSNAIPYTLASSMSKCTSR